MSALMSIVLASGNAGKLREFDALFAPLGVKLIPQGALNIPDAPEPHPTFLENALAKARHASLLSGLPALADDSGLCVAALNAEPGIHSARYAEAEHGSRSDAANNQKLVRVLQGQSNRRAWYVAVLVLVSGMTPFFICPNKAVPQQSSTPHLKIKSVIAARHCSNYSAN